MSRGGDQAKADGKQVCNKSRSSELGLHMQVAGEYDLGVGRIGI